MVVGRTEQSPHSQHVRLFPHELLRRSAELIRIRYPIELISGIVSIPTRDTNVQAENFIRHLASILTIEHLPIVARSRLSLAHQQQTSHLQKTLQNDDLFQLHSPEYINGKHVLLIAMSDESRPILRAVGRMLMQARAQAIYPLAITHTTSDSRDR